MTDDRRVHRNLNACPSPSPVSNGLVAKLAVGQGNYWLSYVVDASGVVFSLAWEIAIRRSSLRDVAVAMIAGFLLWGLFEYVFHRWIYHRPRSILGDAHRMHHDAPRTLLAMPWFITAATIFGLWYLGASLLRLPLFSAGIAGWLTGSAWYSVLHHSHHHWDIRSRWLRRLRTHHRIHHRLPHVNFGVTMRLWDSAFGTRYRRLR